MTDHPILRLRRARNMTQSRLAEACGLSPRTIKRAERGAPLSDETVLAICSVLGCAASDLSKPAVVEAPPREVAVPLNPIAGAIAAGAIASTLTAILTVELVAAAPPVPLDELGRHGPPAASWATTPLVVLMMASMLGIMACMASLTCREMPWVRRRMPRPAFLGPYATAMLTASSTVFPVGVAAMAVAEGNILGASVDMLYAALWPPFAVALVVLVAHGDGRTVRGAAAQAKPFLWVIALVTQAVGLASGGLGAAAFSTILFAPGVLTRASLPENARWLCFVAMLIPAGQEVFVRELLHPSTTVSTIVTLACVVMADVLGATLAFGSLRGGSVAST